MYRPQFTHWVSSIGAIPPYPLTDQHGLIPLHVQQVDHRLFVLALASDPDISFERVERLAIEARFFAQSNLLNRHGEIFSRLRLDY